MRQPTPAELSPDSGTGQLIKRLQRQTVRARSPLFPFLQCSNRHLQFHCCFALREIVPFPPGVQPLLKIVARRSGRSTTLSRRANTASHRVPERYPLIYVSHVYVTPSLTLVRFHPRRSNAARLYPPLWWSADIRESRISTLPALTSVITAFAPPREQLGQILLREPRVREANRSRRARAPSRSRCLGFLSSTTSRLSPPCRVVDN